MEHLKTIFHTLLTNKLYVNHSKCLIRQQQVEYLGHIISPLGASADPEKIKCMQNWPTLTMVIALRGFLGLTGYYRKFIRHYGSIAAPLTRILLKDAFVWTKDAEEAFQQLKQAMLQPPVLALPDLSKLFIVEVDAFGSGMGAVLMQESQLVAFYSQAFSMWALGQSIYEKELMAIVHVVNKWRNYLLGRKFRI